MSKHKQRWYWVRRFLFSIFIHSAMRVLSPAGRERYETIQDLGYAAYNSTTPKDTTK